MERQKQRLLKLPPELLHLLVEHAPQEAERLPHDELPNRLLQDTEPQRRPDEPPEQHLLQEPQLLLELPPPHQLEELELAPLEPQRPRCRRLLHLEQPPQPRFREYLQQPLEPLHVEQPPEPLLRPL